MSSAVDHRKRLIPLQSGCLASIRARAPTPGLCLAVLCLLGAQAASAAQLLSVPTPIKGLPPTQSPAPHVEPVQQEPLRLGDTPFLQHPLQRPDATDPQLERELQQLRADVAREALVNARTGSLKTPPAVWLLGLIQLHGAGVDQDRAAARASFEQARRLGFGLASAGLAWCAIDGCSGAPDVAQARRWITELRLHAPARALYLEWMLATRLAPLRLSKPGPNQTTTEGTLPQRELLLRSATAGDPQALNELGLESMAAGRRSEALRHFKAAALHSEAAAANLQQLQQMLLPPQPPGSGAATSAGDALYAEAQRFHRGEGRPANHGEAIRLYRMASVQGSAAAQRMLAMIYARPSATGDLEPAWMQQLSGLDLGSELPRLGLPSTRSEPQRDPTPLFDMLPSHWRKRDQFLTR